MYLFIYSQFYAVRTAAWPAYCTDVTAVSPAAQPNSDVSSGILQVKVGEGNAVTGSNVRQERKQAE
jgi:hypothetical protein